MGKMKELMIEKENNLAENIAKLEENTEKLNEEDFDDEVDLSNVKCVISELVKLVKEIKELVLL